MKFFSPELAAQAKGNLDGDKPEFAGGDVFFTFTEQQDEQELYNELNSRLAKLESRLEVDTSELEAIREAATGFRLQLEEKKEVLLRIDWLERMNRVKVELLGNVSAERAAQLQTLLAPVQSCPLKNQLMEALKSIEPLKSNDLMDLALEQAGDTFLNLGKTGREHIIAQAGKDANIDKVRNLAEELEQRMVSLSTEKDEQKLAEALSSLPLKSLMGQEESRKLDLARRLVQEEWDGLMALDRKVARLIEQLEKEEIEKNPYPTTIEAEKLGQLLRDN